MLREFIRCASTADRVKMLENTVLDDWTGEELDTILEIMGAKEECSHMSKEDKVAAIAKKLSSSKEVEHNVGMDLDFDKVDALEGTDDDTKEVMERLYKMFD